MAFEDDEGVSHGDDSARPWLDKLSNAETAMDSWQRIADRCDKAYSDLSHLDDIGRDREFQLFWSNIQLIGPSIYAKSPVPVVAPKFKDRRPLPRTASEFLERCCIIAFDRDDIDHTMKALRDDLVITGRGAVWVRYEDDGEERVTFEHLHRHDFRHDPARSWREVDWVARRAWLGREEINERFPKADFEGLVEDDSVTGLRMLRTKTRYGVWEIWDRPSEQVLWVAEGHPDVLERSSPHIRLEGFFPCPRPAYATLERDSLIPVPDLVFYKDQLDEVNDYTQRIHALAQAIKVRGFYAGGGDIGAAVEKAIQMEDDRAVMIPIPNMGGLVQGAGDPIIWMPLEMVADTIQGLIELRRQAIEDIYQVVGLSDIMRGVVDANEKLGQSRLKQQNSSLRIQDKQNELVRVARDMSSICGEIMAEEFDQSTLVEMSQMSLPTNAEVKRSVKALEKDAKKALEELGDVLRQRAEEAKASGEPFDEEAAQQAQTDMLQEWSERISDTASQVTIDQVMGLLRDQKLRPFVLDIETDSTIFADEVAEKETRTEFMAAFAHTLQTLTPLMALGPEAISIAGTVMKFALAPYRVGREIEAAVDDFIDQGAVIAERAAKQGGEGDDDTGLADAQMALAQAEMAKVESQTAANQATAELRQQELMLKAAEAQTKMEQEQQKAQIQAQATAANIQETLARVEKVFAEIQLALRKVDLDERKQIAQEAKDAVDTQMRQTDQVIAAAKVAQPRVPPRTEEN